MSNEANGSRNAATSDALGDWSRMWADMAAQVAETWQSNAGPTASPEFLRKGRSDMMQVWSDWCEQWMRSADVLKSQKQSMDGMLALRKQVREYLRLMQRELRLAGADDIDNLVSAVRRSQRRVLDQLEENADRMQALESKLDRLAEQIGQWMNDAGTAPDAPKGKRKHRQQE